MTVSFELNGKPASIETPPNTRLVDLLRQSFGQKHTRAGCYRGTCGTCGVLLNNELVHSCLIPAFAVQRTKIVTYEGISGLSECKDILEGLELAGVEPCDDCFQGKILTIYSLLAGNPLPRRKHVAAAVGWHRCGCTDTDSICRAVDTIVNVRRYHRHAGR